MSLIPPAQARARIVAAAPRLRDIERVALAEGLGRTLAADLSALRTQPPFAASAMDGYALRAQDAEAGQPLQLIGEAAAGHPFQGIVGPGQTVRIFTGAPIPDGADAVLIQENAVRQGETVFATEPVAAGRFVRPAGLDFQTGAVLLRAGVVLDPPKIGLAASMGHANLPVRRRPRVALVSTGDELVTPGTPPGPGQIISSNAIALAALIRATGGEALDFGIVPDEPQATRDAISRAASGADLLVTCGGASVGDRDLVQAALGEAGFAIDFWKVALRPGKPFLFGTSPGRLALACQAIRCRPMSAPCCSCCQPSGRCSARALSSPAWNRRRSPAPCPPTTCARNTCARASAATPMAA